MNLHRRYNPIAGYTRIVERGEMRMAGLEFGILNLSPGESFFEDTADSEVALVVLGGKCELLVGHNGNKAHGLIGERPNVFDGEGYRAYIPYRTTYELLAHEAPVEVAICKAPSHLETAALILAPGDDLGGSVRKVAISETSMTSVSGEAVCFYRFDPAEGCANQRIYNDSGSTDPVISVRHNDVLALPEGYHAERVPSTHRMYRLTMCVRCFQKNNHPERSRRIAKSDPSQAQGRLSGFGNPELVLERSEGSSGWDVLFFGIALLTVTLNNGRGEACQRRVDSMGSGAAHASPILTTTASSWLPTL